MDFAYVNGKDFLVIVDYMSKFIVVKQLSAKKGNVVVNEVEDTFPYLGIPMVIMTDNGPPFSSEEFRSFLVKHDINQATSSPL